MTVYDFVCKNHEPPIYIEAPGAPDCPICGVVMKKNWASVQLRGAPAFQPHFNHAVGRYVSSSRDFDEALKRGGEDQNTTLTRIDPGDFASITPSTDTEAIETSARVRRDSGLTPPSTTSIIV